MALALAIACARDGWDAFVDLLEEEDKRRDETEAMSCLC